MIQLDIRSRTRTKNLTPARSVVRNLTPAPTPQPWFKVLPQKLEGRFIFEWIALQ